jgi:hypothetical protein
VVGGGSFDCVLMNPPFGTQKHSNGVDMAFLRAGLALCAHGGAVYSLHKTSTRAYIAKRAAGWGAGARVVAELHFEIPRMYKHHKKASLDVAVDFWRLVPGAAGESSTEAPPHSRSTTPGGGTGRPTSHPHQQLHQGPSKGSAAEGSGWGGRGARGTGGGTTGGGRHPRGAGGRGGHGRGRGRK